MYYNQYPQYYQPMGYNNFSYQGYQNQVTYQDYYKNYQQGYGQPAQNYYGYPGIYGKQQQQSYQQTNHMSFYPNQKQEYVREVKPVEDKSASIYDKMYAFNVSSSKNLTHYLRRTKSDATLACYNQETRKVTPTPKRDEAPKAKTHKKRNKSKGDGKKRAAHEPSRVLKQSLSQNQIQNESTVFAKTTTTSKSANKKKSDKLNGIKQTGLTATEDVDKLLENMGYLLPPTQTTVSANSFVPIGVKEKQDMMFSYGLTEQEFDKAEQIFTSHSVNGKFEIKNLTKIFSLADRIQISELTNDDGDFLKFEEYLNIYQILKDLDL